MAKEFVINTNRVNAYGTRILTSGIDLTQFEKNPILLFMHRRSYDGERMPIGRVENLRMDGDRLIGTPVFDLEDEFAAKISRKWDNDFLRMCSAGIEPIEFSSAPEHVSQGQTRATITKSKLIEVSIVDIGANDDALKLYEPGGKLLQLAAGVDNEIIPLLKPDTAPDASAPEADTSKNNQNPISMNKILLALGLPEGTTEDAAVDAVNKLKTEAARAATIELARIENAVERAIEAKQTTADKRDHFIALGKAAGFDTLEKTLGMLTPAQKPTDIINQAGGAAPAAGTTLSYGKMSADELREMRKNDRAGYIKLYKAEFGFEPEIEE